MLARQISMIQSYQHLTDFSLSVALNTASHCLFVLFHLKVVVLKMFEIRRNWFSVLIVLFSVLILCSNAVNYRKSNNSRKHLFPLTLIHINDFHARYLLLSMTFLKCFLMCAQIHKIA